MKKQQKETCVLVSLGIIIVLMLLLIMQVHQLFRLEKIDYMMERKGRGAHTQGFGKGTHTTKSLKKEVGMYEDVGDRMRWEKREQQMMFRGGYQYRDQWETSMEIVDTAIEYFTRDKEEVLQDINDPDGSFIIDDIYVFAIEGDLIIAHPFRKDLVNTDISVREDIHGHKYGRELVGATTRGGWIDYHFNIPDQSAIAQKHTYCRRIPSNPEYVICAGYYEE